MTRSRPEEAAKVQNGGKGSVKQDSVMVVDDDESLLGVLKQRFVLDGYRCETAASAESALEHIRRTSFDILLTDISLPGMKGFELTEKAKKLRPGMTIIIMTGFIDEFSYDSAVDAGAADFIKKPFTFRELMVRIEHARAQEKQRLIAMTDELTGLGNRRGFFILAEKQLSLAKRQKKGFFMLYVDVDNLKGINDALGHQKGDVALIDTSRLLKATFRESDILARIGGDEFVVIPVAPKGGSPEAITTRLLQNLKNYNARRKNRWELSISFGVAHFDPDNPCSVDELLAQGDRMMYEQKRLKQKASGFSIDFGSVRPLQAGGFVKENGCPRPQRATSGVRERGMVMSAVWFCAALLWVSMAAPLLAFTDSEVLSLQEETVGKSLGQRIAVWAERFVGTPYDPDPLGEYVTKKVIVADDRVDCMYLSFRSVELALASTPAEAVQIALDKRFMGKGRLDNGAVLNYEDRFQYGEDMLDSGKWGTEITGDLGPLSVIAGSRGRETVSIITKETLIRESGHQRIMPLKSGDFIFFVRAPAKRAGDEIVGHIGIIKLEGDTPYLIHAGGSKNKGGKVKKVLFSDYIKSMPFAGIRVSRFLTP